MSGQNEPTEILDLEKWILKTTESVKHVLNEANMPCVGFSLVFLDHQSKDEVIFNYKTRILGGDPHEDPDSKTRQNIRLAFEFLAAGVKKIMSGEFNVEEDNVADFRVTGSFH